MQNNRSVGSIDESNNIVRLAVMAMGTRFELVLAAPIDGITKNQLRAAGQAAIDVIEEYDARYSLFRRDSLLSYINTNAYRRPVKVDPDTFDLLKLCKKIYEKSDGAFDITVAPMMKVLGFHKDVPEADYNQLLPKLPDYAGETGIEFEVVRAVGMDGVKLDSDNYTVAFLRPGMAVDLGGVAKGFALDKAASELRDVGVDCALIHGGTSSAIAIGKPPGLEGWRIAINTFINVDKDNYKKADQKNKGKIYPCATICDQALAVSAQHGRMITSADGHKMGHIIDPRTGFSAGGDDKHSIITAVVTSTACLADAWSTALLVNEGNKGCEPAVIEDDITAMIIRVDKNNKFTSQVYGTNNKHNSSVVFSQDTILKHNTCNPGDSKI